MILANTIKERSAYVDPNVWKYLLYPLMACYLPTWKIEILWVDNDRFTLMVIYAYFVLVIISLINIQHYK